MKLVRNIFALFSIGFTNRIKGLMILALVFITGGLQASNIKYSKPILYTDNGKSYALLNISWENSWKNERNHDAAWLFFKFLKGNGGYNHVKLLESGHEATILHSGNKLKFQVSKDRLGVFISPELNFRGKVSATIKILLDNESFKGVNTRTSNFTAYAIEMVKIPKGEFSVGSPDTTAIKFGGLYKSDRNGNFKGVFNISKESQSIKIGPQEGNLYYQKPDGYEGDQEGVIPARFPKGVSSFYIMKYEPTQSQYADFLNSLSEGQSQNRVNFSGKGYYENKGSIYYKGGQYVAKNPLVPCNFMSWDDSMAYADWSGLRPMTEFEFTKASRGVKKPANNDFPWGTNSKDKIQRMVNEDGTLKMLNGWDEAKLDNTNKEYFAASYYWVMDLAGSLWERVITIGHPKGRSFLGSHGDGVLSDFGFATNDDWPSGITEEGGFGYRGGGFYGYGRDYHDFNPYSPVAFRPYGAWSGGNRTKSYGARFVKTID